MAWGSALDQPFVTQMLPVDSAGVMTIKLLLSLNVFFSFALIISPTNSAVEYWLCSCLRGHANFHWVQNFARFVIVITAILLGIFLAEKMEKFLGLIGALFCSPLAIGFPAALHLK